MTLQDIANTCWNNRATISLGDMTSWPCNIFLKVWFKINAPELWVVGNDAPGWYWFEASMPLSDLKALARPEELPKSACDFGNVSRLNDALFDSEICQKKTHIGIVYNGHDANVISRIRAHYLGISGNGSLGLRYYTISKCNWSVSLFHRKMLNKMSHLSDEKKSISDFCSNHTGRIAIEGVWRTIYGWPVLCKA